jgi:hypothetical protein
MLGEDYRSSAMKLMEKVDTVNQTLRAREKTIIDQVDLINSLRKEVAECKSTKENSQMTVEDLWQENMKQLTTTDDLKQKLSES